MVLLATVKVKYRHDLWFLRPSDPKAGPTQDTVVSGEVVLVLPWAKKVKRIDVELVGRQNVNIGQKHEHYETLRRDVTMNPYEQYGKLEAGEHRFAWSFVIPANTAPYERSHYGITKHFLRAKVYGVGSFHGDLEDTSVLCCVANNNAPGMAASGFNEISESVNATLGPVRTHLFSKYLIISGFLRLSLSLPVLSESVEIRNVSLVLTQHHHLQSLQSPSLSEERDETHLLWDLASGAPLFGYHGTVMHHNAEKDDRASRSRSRARPQNGTNTPEVASSPTQAGLLETATQFPMFSSTGDDPDSLPVTRPMDVPVRIDAGRELSLVRQVRLPNDDAIRQTTNAHSVTGIRISHTLTTIIRFVALDDPEASLKEYRIAFPANINSCDCSIEQLELPNYEEATTPSSETQRQWRTQMPRDCLCSLAAREAESVEARYGVGKDRLVQQEDEDRWGHEARVRDRGRTNGDRQRWKDEARDSSGSRDGSAANSADNSGQNTPRATSPLPTSGSNAFR